MSQLLGENECEILTHSQQQSQPPKTHKKESTVRLTASGPPKISPLQA